MVDRLDGRPRRADAVAAVVTRVAAFACGCFLLVFADCCVTDDDRARVGGRPRRLPVAVCDFVDAGCARAIFFVDGCCERRLVATAYDRPLITIPVSSVSLSVAVSSSSSEVDTDDDASLVDALSSSDVGDELALSSLSDDALLRSSSDEDDAMLASSSLSLSVPESSDEPELDAVSLSVLDDEISASLSDSAVLRDDTASLSDAVSDTEIVESLSDDDDR